MPGGILLASSLCVSHASEDVWAFFGYRYAQIYNKNATWMNLQPAYKMFTFNATDNLTDARITTMKRQMIELSDGKLIKDQDDQGQRPALQKRDTIGAGNTLEWTLVNFHQGKHTLLPIQTFEDAIIYPGAITYSLPP